MPKNDVPTSDIGDEVGGILNDGTRMGQGHRTTEQSLTPPMSASERIRNAAQLRASSYRDWDDEIISPGSMRLKVLDASSDESDLELSPTKRPRRAAVQRAPRYNLKLSLTRPANADIQKTRGTPQVLSAPQKSGMPPSISTLLRQKHQQQRKGLDRDSLAMMDQLASQHDQIKREILSAQSQINAAHFATKSSSDSSGFGASNANRITDARQTQRFMGVTEPKLLHLLQMDEDLLAESHESVNTGPMLWTSSFNIPKLHMPAILETNAKPDHFDEILPLITTSLMKVECLDLVPWLITRILLSADSGPCIAMRDLAHTDSAICDSFWSMLPKVMFWMGADLPRPPTDSLGSSAMNVTGSDSLEMVCRFWRLCRTMPINATCKIQFPLLAFYAATLPYSVETTTFLSQCLPAQASQDTIAELFEFGKHLCTADQLKLVQSLPVGGCNLQLRSSLALTFLNKTAEPMQDSLDALEHFMLRITAEQQCNYTQLHSQLRLYAYAIDIPFLLGLHSALPRIAAPHYR
ncbi:hypothetical protein MPSI1_002823 [Malassezia psittaci]|uniref:Uncharacterized protein n=1 Tax=Malassezia psittaci TaxID=1821823 RepID=A0AAF0JEL4_9BASI|nr:hypothetical protein MPSI1_002823 [Malassezia psittaci]